MSVEEVTKSVLESLKVILKEKLTELVPTLMKEIEPDLIKYAKESIEDFVIDNNLLLETVKETLLSTDEEVEQFLESFASLCDEKLVERENNYWKFTRCDRLLNLYNDCLQCEPMYIPKQFRSDKYHVMSRQELNIVIKMGLKRLQGECEIMNCRKEEFLNRVQLIDQEIEELINQSNLSPKATKILLDRWKTFYVKDTTKVDKKWDKRIESTKRAFEKDKKFLSQHQENRVGNKVYSIESEQRKNFQITVSAEDESKRTCVEVPTKSMPSTNVKVTFSTTEGSKRSYAEVTSPTSKKVSDTVQSSVSVPTSIDSNKDCANGKDYPDTYAVPSEDVIVNVPKNLESHPSHNPPIQPKTTTYSSTQPILPTQQPTQTGKVLRKLRSSTSLVKD